MAGTNPEMDQAMIQQVAAQQLGAPAPQAPPSPSSDPKQDNPPSEAEKMQEAGGPETEGDKAREEAFIEVELGDGRKEVMSASQIAGMASRYKDLNHKNATKYKPLEPAIGVLEQIMENAAQAGNQVGGDDMAQFLQAAITAYTSNPQMGGQQDPTPDRPDSRGRDADESIENEIAQWEADNAVSLPPMYRQGMSLIRQLQAENNEMKEMMSGFLQQAQGVNQEAMQAVQGSQEQAADVYRQRAANNLNQAQAALQLPDDAEDDFFDFAYGRGYTVEDFIDSDLTMKVMQDFANNRSTPEMERLRSLNQRRQAFTGAANATPSAGAAPAGSPDQAFMDNLTQMAMQKRGIR
jgi:hypothetical protein